MWSAEECATFWGFRADDVFGSGDLSSSEDNGEWVIQEEPLETWVLLITEASVGGEEDSLDDACSSVALGVDPLDDVALQFRDSLRFF